MRKKMIWIAPLAVLAMFAFMALGGYIVMLLWNWLLPPLFGFHLIAFWQALGILILCRILFGGFGMHRGRGSRRMAGRCGNLTEEERERFRQRMRDRFGTAPSPGESNAQ